MGNNEDFRDQATLRKWERYLERSRAEGEAAEMSLKKFISDAMKNKETFRNLCADELRLRKSGEVSTLKPGESGFLNKYNETVTGYEKLPWDDDRYRPLDSDEDW